MFRIQFYLCTDSLVHKFIARIYRSSNKLKQNMHIYMPSLSFVISRLTHYLYRNIKYTNLFEKLISFQREFNKFSRENFCNNIIFLKIILFYNFRSFFYYTSQVRIILHITRSINQIIRSVKEKVFFIYTMLYKMENTYSCM